MTKILNTIPPYSLRLGYRGPRLPGMTIKGGKAFYQGKEITARDAIKIKKELDTERKPDNATST